MSVNTEILKLENLSSLLTTIKIGYCCDSEIESAIVLMQEMGSYTYSWDPKCSLKLAVIIKEFTKEVNSYYENKFIRFDNADDLEAFDKKYDIRETVCSEDYKYINIVALLHFLQIKYCDENYHRIAKRNMCSIIGRFLALHYGSFDITISDYNEFTKHPFYNILHNYLKSFSLYDWDIDESVYLKLAVYNLLDVMGEDSADIVKQTWISICEEIKSCGLTLNEYATNIILHSFEKFYQTVKLGKIIEPLDTTWLNAYIYKQRFGYIYCKKITKSKLNVFYPFTYRATSLCFKALGERVTGNSQKVVLFEKGVLKRSSDYQPLESEILFNFTTMKYE